MVRVASYLNSIELANSQLQNSNIFLGISLGNKYFTEERVKRYLLWSLSQTKEAVAILIPDKIHPINYEVKSGWSRPRSVRVAEKIGQEIYHMIAGIIEMFQHTTHDTRHTTHDTRHTTEKYRNITLA